MTLSLRGQVAHAPLPESHPLAGVESLWRFPSPLPLEDRRRIVALVERVTGHAAPFDLDLATPPARGLPLVSWRAPFGDTVLSRCGGYLVKRSRASGGWRAVYRLAPGPCTDDREGALISCRLQGLDWLPRRDQEAARAAAEGHAQALDEVRAALQSSACWRPSTPHLGVRCWLTESGAWGVHLERVAGQVEGGLAPDSRRRYRLAFGRLSPAPDVRVYLGPGGSGAPGASEARVYMTAADAMRAGEELLGRLAAQLEQEDWRP